MISPKKNPKWAGFQGEFGEKDLETEKTEETKPRNTEKTPEIPKDTVTDLDIFDTQEIGPGMPGNLRIFSPPSSF